MEFIFCLLLRNGTQTRAWINSSAFLQISAYQISIWCFLVTQMIPVFQNSTTGGGLIWIYTYPSRKFPRSPAAWTHWRWTHSVPEGFGACTSGGMKGVTFFLTLKPSSMRFDYNHCPIAELHNLWALRTQQWGFFFFLYRRLQRMFREGPRFQTCTHTYACTLRLPCCTHRWDGDITQMNSLYSFPG